MLGFPLLWSLLVCIFTNQPFSIHMADGFFFQLLDSRICHIRGVLGGGKTSLAFMLTVFLRNLNPEYKYVATNVPCDLEIYPPPHLSNGVFDTIVVLDEAGTYVGNRDWETNPTEFYQALRKLNTIVLAPSKSPLDIRLSELWVQNVFKLGKLAWFYYWGYELGKEKRDGFFFVWKPTGIFNTYSTGIFSTDADDILNLFRVSLEMLRRQASSWRSYVVSDTKDILWSELVETRQAKIDADRSKKRGWTNEIIERLWVGLDSES